MNLEITAKNVPKYVALIPAAGVGTRMGAAIPKQYLQLGSKVILQHAVDAFLDFAQIRHVYVVVSPDDDYIDNYLQSSAKLSILRIGGASRRDTVCNGLHYLGKELRADDWVMVHDAARPGLNEELLTRLISQVADSPVGGLLALPVVDTVKRVVNGKVQTVSRDGLWLAQTPQMFRYQLLLQALENAESVTDEASAIEAAGYVPLLVEGHACNLKVTLASDMDLVANQLKTAHK
ncbi:2-C-methyl-D-erythritol 4-phosphate cytidylyltransferase [Undibacterium sp. TS12]|uniref:2-C-methyl-D-erythritol 4-phosphate cytidylyltransferase n=1 Tax=Undibacterium sp. TS12 TaxID=2908202 RepID=UPI001F4C697A|nr:2-C-methyl-D-erythritol 4-phosphate cytidylyltransferase [Undibacterium sp. TS12]MCH8618448.1 2-C-methyl-D-erythritol 4-phosphate cytidylyltransferase [Undibacterium sp. TS12]